MSCCGNKRRELLNRSRSSAPEKTIETDASPAKPETPDRVFEYTGRYALNLTGVATGNRYNFKFRGQRIRVNHMDAYAMMAERDLKVLPKEAE